ncbi:MAG TPA: hypothetical protein VMV48_03060 [Gallionellaceae bacterium]|nr:hypothetical protein [Gallionellaceae bacterium]
MDKKTVFVKTNTGESEVSGQSDALYGDAKRILFLVDDESTVGEISKRAPPSLREALDNVLQELVDGGYIRDARAPVNVPQKPSLKMATPGLKMATPKAAPSSAATPGAAPPSIAKTAMPPPEPKQGEPAGAGKSADLDFSFITSGAGSSEADAKVAKEKAQAEAAAEAEAPAKAGQAGQAAQVEAAAKAAKLKAYEDAKEKAKIEVAMRARIEAEIRGKNEAESARLKAEQEALKARTELEASKARVEAEVRARIEAEARVKQELEAAQAKAEAEMRSRLEAEERAKAEAEARVKREAEAERLRIEKEQAELEIARVKAEAEIKMRAEAERLRIEKERAELELARVKAEAEIKMRTEAELRVRAEVEARLKAESLARQAELRSAQQDMPTAKEEHVDPAEKLRQSFVESFGQDKGKPKSGPLNFKLDKFTLADTGKMPAATLKQQTATASAGGGSKVKAAIEQRAQKEAEDLRVKAEQDAAQLKAQQDEAARIKAEQESLRLKAEQEAYRLKVTQEEAKAKADADAKKLTEQQAKQWEEAQRRAATQAQAEKERQAQQSAEAKISSQKKTARTPRKPLPIGKIVSGLFVMALIAVAVLPYVWPLDEYIAPLEREISVQLNQPVQIKKISVALLPLPRLELHNLSVGKGQELKVGDAVLNFDFSALFAPTRSISKMELSNVNLSAASLDKVLLWLQAAGGNERYPVTRMELKGVQISDGEIRLPLFKGRADFDLQGKFSKADLKSEDDKYGLELQSLQNGLQLALNIHEGSLPILSNYKFSDLSASGFVVNGEFAFADLFAHIHGGTLTGKGKLSWSNGWKLEGQLNAKSLELQSMFPNFGVTGQLYGDVNLSMFGNILSQLDKDPRLEGTFEARDGVINKLDIDTVARFGSRQGGGGRTSFTELSGTLKADNRSQRFYLNKIAAGSVSGSGLVEIDSNQELAGKLLVDVRGVDKGSVPMQLSGSPTQPLLQAGR